MTAPVFVCVLPMPPTTNNLYPTVLRGGRPVRVKSKQYTDWLNGAGYLINAAAAKARAEGMALPLSCEVSLSLTIQRPRKGSDVTNRNKAVEDALVAFGVIKDDSYVSDARQVWARDGEGGIKAGHEVTVRVREYRPAGVLV